MKELDNQRVKDTKVVDIANARRVRDKKENDELINRILEHASKLNWRSQDD